jgi:hypothetical protein
VLLAALQSHHHQRQQQASSEHVTLCAVVAVSGEASVHQLLVLPSDAPLWTALAEQSVQSVSVAATAVITVTWVLSNRYSSTSNVSNETHNKLSFAVAVTAVVLTVSTGCRISSNSSSTSVRSSSNSCQSIVALWLDKVKRQVRCLAALVKRSRVSAQHKLSTQQCKTKITVHAAVPVSCQ